MSYKKYASEEYVKEAIENIAIATTTDYGLTQLSDEIDNASSTVAATANAVKKVYDLINEAIATAASIEIVRW